AAVRAPAAGPRRSTAAGHSPGGQAGRAQPPLRRRPPRPAGGVSALRVLGACLPGLRGNAAAAGPRQGEGVRPGVCRVERAVQGPLQGAAAAADVVSGPSLRPWAPALVLPPGAAGG